MSTASVLVWLVLAVAADQDATEVLLKDGTKFVGEYRSHDEVALVLAIEFGGTGGSATRPFQWTEIEEIDGLTIAEWLEERATQVEEPPPEEPVVVGNVVERFQVWLGQCRGMGVGYAIGALALLVLIPAWILHQAGKLMGMRELEPTRSLFGALLALGAAWAALKTHPACAGGVPWLPVGAVTLMIWLAIRPTVGRWVVLSLLSLGSLLGVAYGVLYLVRYAP